MATLSLAASACGSRLTGSQVLLAQGAFANGHGAATAHGGTTQPDASAAQAVGTGASVPANVGATQSPVGAASAGTGSAAGQKAAPGPVSGSRLAASPASCEPNGNQMPAGGNGGATATGVTANSISVGNIASISGVAPGISQSAQQAIEAWAA